MKVEYVIGKNCTSTGDALRYLDELNRIKNDFILVYGDIVSNVNLKIAMENHLKRRKKDSHCIMTMVIII